MQAWKLRYDDVLVIWRACGAVWIAESGGGGSGRDGVQEQDGEESDEEDGDECTTRLKSNLTPALNVVEACLRTG